MGGRGSSSGNSAGGSKKTGGGGGKKKAETLFTIPSGLTQSKLKGMSRSRLENIATAVFANMHMKQGTLSKSEAVARATDLMSGNTTAQLRKFIYKYNK